MAPALILIRQNTNRTRQIVACKRSFKADFQSSHEAPRSSLRVLHLVKILKHCDWMKVLMHHSAELRARTGNPPLGLLHATTVSRHRIGFH